MSCTTCAITADVDGKRVHVLLLFDAIEKLAWSNERNAVLYRCPACGTFWESAAYEPASTPLTAAEVARFYPGVAQ